MSARDRECDVCIVGGGPAGLVLANLLAEHGLSTLVLERAADFEREFRGEVLQPRFMRAMAEIGLAELIRAQPHEEFAHARFFDHGRQVGSFAFARVDAEYPFATWMTQPILLRALHARATTLSAYELWFGARAHGLLVEDGRVVGVRVRSGEAEHVVRARLVVGADGRFSTIAKLAEVETAYEHHPFDVLWFEIDRPANEARQLAFYFAETAYLSAPKYPDLFQIGMAIPPGAFRSYRERGVAAMRAELGAAHPWFHAFAERLHDFGQFHVLQATHARRRPWAKDGLLLVGDAAHTCSPIGAVGVSIAVETAIVAADVVLAHRDGPFTAALLGEVERRRDAAVRQIHRMQRVGGEMVASRSRVIRALRPWMIRLATWTGLLPRLAARMITRRESLAISPSLRLTSNAHGSSA